MILIRKSTIKQVEKKEERKRERKLKNALLKVKRYVEIGKCKCCHSIYISRLKDLNPYGDNYTFKCPSCGIHHTVNLFDIYNYHGINSLVRKLNIIFYDTYIPSDYKNEIHEYIRNVLTRKK